MKRKLVVSFILVVLGLVAHFWQPMVVQAQTLNDFPSCAANPGACACTSIIRNTKTGETWTVDGNDNNFVLWADSSDSYQVAMFAPNRSRSNKEDCYIRQENSNQNPLLGTHMKAMGGGCNIGAGIGELAGSRTTGCVVGTTLTSIPGAPLVLLGEIMSALNGWDPVGSTKHDFKCYWGDRSGTREGYEGVYEGTNVLEVGAYDWRVSPWVSISKQKLKDGHVSRIVFQGNLGSIANDENYCTLNLIPGTGEDDTGIEAPAGETFSLCEQIPDEVAKGNCTRCSDIDGGVWTAVGCISSQPNSMVKTIMGIGLSLAGGICVLMILAAGFTFSTSQGDPKKTGQAKEMMTSAIVGLVFILFSVTLLQFIGVRLLQIPGLGV